jgi:hypothetical protein
VSDTIRSEVAIRDFARSIGVEPDGDPAAILAEVERAVRKRWGQTAHLVLQTSAQPFGWVRLVVEDGHAAEGEQMRLFWAGRLPGEPHGAVRRAMPRNRCRREGVPPREPASDGTTRAI